MVVFLVRLNRQYETEAERARARRPRGGRSAPILRRHVVLVLVDRLDLAAARAIQYARTLTPDELRAVHFDLDHSAPTSSPTRGPARPDPHRPRHRRLPRPAHHPRRRRTRRPRPRRRRDRGERAAPRPQVQRLLAPHPPRPDRRRDRARRVAASPTPTSPPSRSTSPPARRPRHRRSRRARPPPPSNRPRRQRAAGAIDPRSAVARPALGPGRRHAIGAVAWRQRVADRRPGPNRSGPQPLAGTRPSNASSRTTPAPCPSCSSAGSKVPGIEIGTRSAAEGVAGEPPGPARHPQPHLPTPHPTVIPTAPWRAGSLIGLPASMMFPV